MPLLMSGREDGQREPEKKKKKKEEYEKKRASPKAQRSRIRSQYRRHTQETRVGSQGQEDPLEEEMATHSSIRA